MWKLLQQLFDFSNWSTITPLGQLFKVIFIIFIIAIALAVLGILFRIVKGIVAFFKWISHK